MIDPAGLVEVARSLGSGSAPSDAALRRSISSAYYALFHALASFAADRLVTAGRDTAAYTLIYRGLDHRKMKDAFEELAKSTLRAAIQKALGQVTISAGLKTFATTFVYSQQFRHLADYHPTIAISRLDVLDLIDESEKALRDLAAVPREELTSVIAYILVGSRA